MCNLIIYQFKQEETNKVINKRQTKVDVEWATRECNRLMNTTLVNMCDEIPGFNTVSFRADCVADALVCVSNLPYENYI